jgi:hypothetical protein
MNATLAPPAPKPAPPPRPLRAQAPPRTPPRRTLPPARLHRAGLALVLLAALGLRLWGVKQGLPFSYNVDEASHFVPRAIAFFSHDLDPRYFLNPPAYSYLLHVAFELWFGSGDAAARAYAHDPTAVFVVARVVAALCGVLSVWLTYVAAERLFDRVVALLAAAILALAFLPVFYSHLALNDVPTLAPVALSLVGIAGVLRGGGPRSYLIAGAGAGLAAATKYTGGYTLVCLLLAAGAAVTGGRGRAQVARHLGLGVLAAVACFVLANPYSVLAPSEFWAGITQQASLADGADPFKLGSDPGSGILYYLWTFTWGLGWGPALAALGGAVLLGVRRRIALALVLIPAPVLYILFMGSEQRFFGRWLMPLFPVAAMLAAYAGVALVRLLRDRLNVPVVAGAVVVCGLLLVQSLVADIHDDQVLSRADTRNLARAWMVEHVPAGAKVVIEPVVSDAWGADIGKSLRWTGSGERWWRYPTWMSHLGPRGGLLPAGQARYVPVDEYERTLYPGLLSTYVQQGYCWVLTGSLQSGRAFADPAAAPRAVAYYRALARTGTLVYRASPYVPGDYGIPFNFDWSIDYLPRQYLRPGPAISIYRLPGPRC